MSNDSGAGPQGPPASGPPAGPPAYPAYGSDPAPHDRPGPPAPSRASGLAIAALIIGIAAFLTGWLPVVGFLLGAGGVVVSILALRRPGGRGLSITGLILSGVAALVNLIVSAIVIVSLVSLGPGATTLFGPDVQEVDTPCYSFDGPAGYLNNQSAELTEACVSTLELWGERDENGEITNTGVGSVLGSVLVEPVRVATSDEMAPDGSLDAMVETLNRDYFPGQGEVTSLKERVTVDGVEANLTRMTSTSEGTQTKAFLTVFAPDTYSAGGEDVRLFIVSFVIPEDNGDEIIDRAVSSWDWD